MTNNKKIKILVCTPTLQCGGSEKFVAMLCNHINTNLFQVCLLVLNNADPFYEIKNKDVAIINLQQKRVLFSLFKLKKLIKDQQPDIVFTTANHLNVYVAIFRNSFAARIKFLARESSIVSINSQRAKMPYLYNLLIKKYYRRFDTIICQSAYMQQDLIKHYNIPAEKTVIINNAVTEKSTNKISIPGNSNSVYKLITIGRLSPEKGIERLIHAVGLLTDPVQFFIIGDGEQKMNLQKLVTDLQLTDKIFFKPQTPEPFYGMEDADLFLLGSYYEGFPNALLEAGALGIPAIAFNVAGGIAEIIREGENGLLVDDNDIIGFAVAVKKGLSANFDRNKITEITNKRFSVNTMLADIEKLFAQLAQPFN